MKNILSFVKRNVISRLDKFRDNHLSEVTNIPKPVPDCYQCGLPEPIYKNFNDGVGVCIGCYNELEKCTYCNSRQISVKNGICYHCIENTSRVLDYSTKPDILFHRIKRGRVDTPPLITYEYSGQLNGKRHVYEHYGVEIECDLHRSTGDNPLVSGNTLASLVALIGKGSTGQENLLYSKNDCTCWVEVVSHPMSWNYWLLYGQEIFQTLFLKLRENKLFGYSASDSGMHIHVSRNAIKPYNIKKLIEFVYNPDNFNFILDISQRTEEKLQEWGNPYFGATERDYLWRSINDSDYARDYLERSTAINLHNNNTIEFRIFRGTLNFQSFSKNLEFVRSLIQWVKVTPLRVCKDSEGLKSYLDFLEVNQNEYQNLCFFLRRRTYGSFDKVTQRLIREYSARINELSYNSDNGELPQCV